ncbi:unnamed protein product, partial [Nesidiocoris tenuis]
MILLLQDNARRSGRTSPLSTTTGQFPSGGGGNASQQPPLPPPPTSRHHVRPQIMRAHSDPYQTRRYH